MTARVAPLGRHEKNEWSATKPQTWSLWPFRFRQCRKCKNGIDAWRSDRRSAYGAIARTSARMAANISARKRFSSASTPPA